MLAEDDIYHNKRKYEAFLASLDALCDPNRGYKYCCQNRANLKQFRRLADVFETEDLSYIRRLRLMRSFQIVTHILKEDLRKVKERDRIDFLIREMRKRGFSQKTQADFITDLKRIWKTLFPDTDVQGRPDETTTPYLVRHLSAKIDKSKERLREDKMTLEEFSKLVQSFNQDVRIQAYLHLAFESLARPQELLYLRIKDVNLHDNYAEVYVSQHGKEGTKLLRCIDSYQYVAGWYNKHPCRNDPNAFFFCNIGQANRNEQMSVYNVDRQIKRHLEALGITKPITSYSLKRNGVTLRILRGESEVDIQKRAGWTTTKQLSTYDLSNSNELFKRELVQRGLIAPDESTRDLQISKTCAICGAINGPAELICYQCKRPLDRSKLLEQENKVANELQDIKRQLGALQQTVGDQTWQDALIEAGAFDMPQKDPKKLTASDKRKETQVKKRAQAIFDKRMFNIELDKNAIAYPEEIDKALLEEAKAKRENT